MKERGNVKRRSIIREAIHGHSARFIKGIRGSDAILRDPHPQFAFVGRSNVGKSSVINALLGTALARPSATPGKTQEINFYLSNDKILLADLPGYGYAKIPTKLAEKLRKMILWYLTSGEAKPIKVILVIDASVGLTPFDEEMIALLREECHPFVILANKVDKLNQKEFSARMRELSSNVTDAAIIPFSAKVGRGVKEARGYLLGE